MLSLANGLRVTLNSASLSFTTEELSSRAEWLPRNIEISVGNGSCFLRSILVFQTVFLRWVHPNISQRASGETYRKARLCLRRFEICLRQKTHFKVEFQKQACIPDTVGQMVPNTRSCLRKVLVFQLYIQKLVRTYRQQKNENFNF